MTTDQVIAEASAAIKVTSNGKVSDLAEFNEIMKKMFPNGVPEMQTSTQLESSTVVPPEIVIAVETVPGQDKLTTIDGLMPAKGDVDSAGWDFFATKQVSIGFGERALIPLGIKTCLPRGYYMQLCDRSGHAWKRGLMIMAGTIDPGYPDEWCAVVLNTSKSYVNIEAGDKICQGVLLPIIPCRFEKVDTGGVAALMETLEFTRKGGFGSTGK